MDPKIAIAIALALGDFDTPKEAPPRPAIVAPKLPRVPDPPPIVKVTPPVVRQTIVTTYRQPVGPHTHTCANGHTSDHQSMGTDHVCNCLVVRNGKIERCGLVQRTQDPARRMVTVTSLVNGPATSPAAAAALGPPSFPGVAPTRPPAPRPPQTYQDFQQMMPQLRTSAGCPPGG